MNDRSLADRFGLHFLAILAGGMLLWQVIGWWNRAPAVEYDNLKYIQLLSTAVSSRKPEMVDKVAAAVRQRHAGSQMSDGELAHFEAIIATARSGQWDEADRAAYDFAAAQLSRKRSPPEPHAGHAHAH
jgi:hypothetical protein